VTPSSPRVNVSVLLRWAVAFALVAAAAMIGHAIAARSGLERLRDAAQHRLDMVAAGIDAELARFDYLPSLLEMSPNVLRLLDRPGDAQLRNEVNRYLQGINATAGAETLYVLDRAGVGRAASDWDRPSTPIGTDLSFRPYMQDALAHGRGRFYGIGITSGRAGYYLSYALYSQGVQRGVATVKVSLEETERTWSKLPGGVLLVDERGVVILSSRAEWKFRPLAPLTPQALADIGQTRPYGKADLLPLEWNVREHLAADADIVSLDSTRYLATVRPVNQARWRLLVMDGTAPVQAAARNLAITAALAVAVLWLLGVTRWQRQRALRQKLAAQAALQAAHDSLESKVIERTADLRAMQTELVHAGKMAVLGQMSAGMVHELNQPLAALRTLSDNACVLLDQDRQGEARGNLQRIAYLVDRLARVTYQLKAFAHKSETPAVPVLVRQVIANAQLLVSQRLRENGVEFDVLLPDPALAALAEEARLEQVLVNLMGNAIDSMAAAPERRLRIEAAVADDRCVITVSDSGPGIRADILPRLFEPFTSTKPAGAGLGLGLMISAHVVREFGGSLRASNPAEGGARFVIELPRAATAKEREHE
jgi:two-component system, NtrC family, C4-dicarboxylate transport sensor histidine kinase DctB